jgi:hypothetical protein
MSHKRRLTLLGITSGLLLIASPVQWAGAEEAISTDFSPVEVVFQPNIWAEAVTLTVSCAGGAYIQQEYLGSAAVSFEPVDQDGLPIEDDLCKYEVRVHPVVDKAAMKAAAESDDGRIAELLAQLEQMQTVVVSGSFDIAGGQIVDPGVTEDTETAHDQVRDGE